MIKIILILVGAILLIWFLLPVFTHRILNIGNVTGIAVSVVLLLYGIFFRPFNSLVAALWRHGAGRVIEIVLGACILAILVLAVLTMISMGKGMRVSDAAQAGGNDAKDKTVIVLGCKAMGERPSLMLEERLQAALKYLEQHPSSCAIVSGGQGKDEILPEAEVMYRWLLEQGIDENRLLKEARSTDTHENLLYCYEILTGLHEGWSTDVVIVTNEFHEYRALRIAKEVGFQAEPLPAATAWWLFPTYYVREMYGILEDWFLTG